MRANKAAKKTWEAGKHIYNISYENVIINLKKWNENTKKIQWRGVNWPLAGCLCLSVSEGSICQKRNIMVMPRRPSENIWLSNVKRSLSNVFRKLSCYIRIQSMRQKTYLLQEISWYRRLPWRMAWNILKQKIPVALQITKIEEKTQPVLSMQ